MSSYEREVCAVSNAPEGGHVESAGETLARVLVWNWKQAERERERRIFARVSLDEGGAYAVVEYKPSGWGNSGVLVL